MSKTIYDHKEIEEKWLASWEEQGLFQGTEKQYDSKTVGQEENSTVSPSYSPADKDYLLFAFAYPSGSGLHVGHVESKTALDILARFKRMNGRQVFFPVGWDAFGLPAENYAVKTGIPPAETTKNAINTFRRQIKRLAISYDWKNEIATSHPEYYKWTQWIFLQLHKKGLAYQKMGMVNWCPSCQTVLANEQVVNGECERCGSTVIQKEMKQWFFKITDYKDELISGLDQVDWPNATKQQQLNWIGKGKGLSINFTLKDSEEKLTIWTKFWETVYGTTFIVIAPEKFEEMNLLQKVEVQNRESVQKYLDDTKKKTEEERRKGEKDKTGVDTGLRVINPVNGREVPLFIADYVLMGVGTAIVMGVPAHDKRDFHFAKKFNLEVLPVVQKQTQVYRSYLIGSDEITDEDLTGIGVNIVGKSKGHNRKIEIPENALKDYQKLITEKLSKGFWNEIIGEQVWFLFKDKQGETTEYYLSQQNILEIATNCAEYNGESLEKTSNLWLYLSQDDWYQPLIIHEDEGILFNSERFDGQDARGEGKTNMAEWMIEQGFAEWKTTYKLRDWLISRQRYWGAPIPIVYDPEGNAHPVKEEHLPWLLPTDVEFKPTGESPLTHSKEFKERVEQLYGKGWRPEYDTMDTFVDSSWYFLRYLDSRNTEVFADATQLQKWLPVDFYMIGPEHIVLHLLYSRFFTKFLRDEGYLHFDEPFMKMRHQGMILGPDGRKMSKSKGNVINPDEIIEKFGADTLRVYEMFMGPIEADKPWNTNSVVGIYRFLNRIHSLVVSDQWSVIRENTEQSQQNLNTNHQTLNTRLQRKLHHTIKKVTQDIPELKFNTAIAAMMELMNIWEEEIRKIESRNDSDQLLHIDDLKAFIKILCPFAPFLSEELWALVDSSHGSIHLASWPTWNEDLLIEEEVALGVQVNGKLRGLITVATQDIQDQSKVLDQAKNDEKVKGWLTDKQIVKEIYIPGKIINIVVK